MKHRNKLRRRLAAKEQRQPGQISSTLRRRMGDALADLFDEFGPDIYAEAILQLKDVILESFQSGFEQLDSTIKDELGKRGVEEARQHIRQWASEIVEDVNHHGLDEVAGALEDYVGSLTAEFQQAEEEEGGDLMGIEPDVEEVSEEEIEEVPAEDAAEDEELNLEDLGLELPEEEAAASFGPLGGRRQRTRRRLTHRTASRRPTAPPVYRLRRRRYR